MDLKSDKRQHIQLELDFSSRARVKPGTGREGIESLRWPMTPKAQLTRIHGWRKYVSETI